MPDPSDETADAPLAERMLQGDTEALGELFSMHRHRLWRMVNFRLDRRLQGRLDADDILQEAYLSACQRLEHFTYESGRMPFIWLRLIVSQTLIDVHRRHFGTQKRDPRRELSISSGWSSESTSLSITGFLLGHLTSPSQAALKAELSQQLEAALSTMSNIDREVLALRHFEELTNSETAQVLNLTEQAASVRYMRALTRLRTIFEALDSDANKR
ncbi:ECF RNA polymerase sigma factor SigD [Maioricimonas rarisocia]|uniref:ECF RNA polymerase sigma factor SigD n=1 Tax=Maioricimonas rarisocia TaxID=2528026 RepID=A0A517ZEY3_9PLAN|nr:sigma-70 family RNA polymerase sigma factor [Maioricimonas rarisocia]QDU41024.1 ECF RNA polymerase sigma factor SigD [Maioricimonas rarisocia]